MTTTELALATPQELAAAAAHKAAENGGGGLPQFDPAPFASELFWLAIVFLVLYVVFSRVNLPKIGKVIEDRDKSIADDRDTAESLTKEAEETLHGYEQSLAHARAESGRMHAEVEAVLKGETEEALQAFQAKADKDIKATEDRLAAGKDAVMDQMHTVAAEIAAAAAEKIIGISTNLDDAKSVVQSLDSKTSKAA